MPTHTQDPVDRFSALTEELRRVPRVRGPAGPVLNLLLDLFVSMLELFACLAEQVRTGQLPVTAPSPRGGASPRQASAPVQTRVPPPDKRPRHGGWLVHRIPEQGIRIWRFSATLGLRRGV